MSRQSYAEVWTFADPTTEYLKAAKNTEVHVYKSGTSEHATIYEQREGGSPASNPFISQENGLILFWANTGDYDIKLHDTTIPARFGDFILGWQSSPVNVEIEAGELSSKGEFIEWSQEAGGAWLPKIKAGSIGTDRLKSALALPLNMLSEGIQQSLFVSGDLKPTGRSSAPAGWLLCNGESKLRVEFASLFAAIGTVFGSSDGTHFTLPDLQGRVPVGAGSGSGLTARTLGEKFGEQSHLLTIGEMPSHEHAVGSLETQYNQITPFQPIGNQRFALSSQEGIVAWVGASEQGKLITGSTAANGGGSAHNVMQPSGVVNYLIKT